MMKLRFAMGLPEAWRLLRVSLRPSRMTAMAFASCFICLLVVAFNYINIEITKEQHFPAVLFYTRIAKGMFFYQLILWVVAIPVYASGALSQEFSQGTWVFQKTTPQPASKLLLGKLLGAGGDMYVASFAGFPFLAFSVLKCGIPTVDVFFVFLVFFCLSVLLSCFCFFLILSIYSENKQYGNSWVAFAVLIPLILIYSAIPVLNGEYGRNFCSIPCLSPVFVIFTKLYPELCPLNKICFYSMKFPLIPFALLFYIGLAFVFFKAAAARMKRLASETTSCWPTAVLMIAFNLFFIGFLMNRLSCDYCRLSVDQDDDSFAILAFANLVFIYLAMPQHTRSIAEIRPWLYKLDSQRNKTAFFFRDDAPMFFTTILLLLVFIATSVIFHAVYFVRFSILDSLLLISGFLLLALRDALFFQGAGLILKKSALQRAAIVYLLLFIAPTMLFFNMRNFGVGKEQQDFFGFIDLTPLTAFAALDSSFTGFPASYILVNGLLTTLFGIVNFRLMSRAKAGISGKSAKING